MSSGPPHRIVVGIGNPVCGDDAAGLAVVQLLRPMLPADIEVVEHETDVTSLVSKLEGCAAAFLVDACFSGRALPGTVHRYEAGTQPLPGHRFGLSTHGLGLADALELARALGKLPSRCIVYGIEGRSFGTGEPRSPAVMAAIPRLAAKLRSEILDAAPASSHRIGY